MMIGNSQTRVKPPFWQQSVPHWSSRFWNFPSSVWCLFNHEVMKSSSWSIHFWNQYTDGEEISAIVKMLLPCDLYALFDNLFFTIFCQYILHLLHFDGGADLLSVAALPSPPQASAASNYGLVDCILSWIENNLNSDVGWLLLQASMLFIRAHFSTVISNTYSTIFLHPVCWFFHQWFWACMYKPNNI